jgi:Family of unknown function (DUF5654)
MSINYTMLFADALGFTIALAWNDAISKMIHRMYPSDGSGTNYRATLLYALIITIMVIIIVAIYNHCRKAVHHMVGFTPDKPAVKSRSPPMADDPDSIIQLWEPPRLPRLPMFA